MKKTFSITSLLIILIITTGFISSELDSDRKNKLQNYKLMIGEFSIQELKSTVNVSWFDPGVENYSPEQQVVEKIKSRIKENDFHISIYLGTWCPDSRREFPHLIKILKQADFNLDHLKIIGLDRDKFVPEVSQEEREKLNITNVPTIIVSNKDGEEINRFVEFPQETLEKDLLKIFSGQDYKHVYDF